MRNFQKYHQHGRLEKYSINYEYSKTSMYFSATFVHLVTEKKSPFATFSV